MHVLIVRVSNKVLIIKKDLPAKHGNLNFCTRAPPIHLTITTASVPNETASEIINQKVRTQNKKICNNKYVYEWLHDYLIG